MSSSWFRVVSGMRLVASTALEQIQKDKIRQDVWTRHVIELARNIDIAITNNHYHNPSSSDLSSQNDQETTKTNSSSPQNFDNETTTTTTTTNNNKWEKVEESHSKDGTNTTAAIRQDVSTIRDTTVSSSMVEDGKWENVIEEGEAVPSTRYQRAFGFATLGIGLAAGTAQEYASRLLFSSNNNNNNNNNKDDDVVMGNSQNATRLAETLCRMRGAALKLGQMLSIQDETFVNPQLAIALEQVRKGANAMPRSQLEQQLNQELPNRMTLLKNISELPFAAASIGQVHTATLLNNNNDETRVAMKVQYPGVAESIDSDLNNLKMLVKMTGMAPPGLFIDKIIQVARKELKAECDYLQEAKHQTRFRDLVQSDAFLTKQRVHVPSVISELTTSRILTSTYCPGSTIDKVSHLCTQEERNRIAKIILYLTFHELIVWRFMQTDPNWGNFLYDVSTQTTHLIDFGASREYDKDFVDGYLRIIWASSNHSHQETLLSQSRDMGFLTGEENDIMINAHVQSGLIIGEPFATDDIYDFGSSAITKRLSQHGSVFLHHRLTPPPEEVYTLHRKIAGAYNLCIKLNAKIKCRDILVSILKEYKFDDGKDHPLDQHS